MLSHSRIWAAIDQLAARNSLTPSALARRAGLDPTTFNKSKRFAADGRPRWPSTESIAKLLRATGTTIEDFLGFALGPRPRGLPLLGLAQAGGGGFFTDGGFPVGVGWDEVALPGSANDGSYALAVSGESMLPLYRNGDIIVVSPSAECRPGDRGVARSIEGVVMAKVLVRRTADRSELGSRNPAHPPRRVEPGEVEGMARCMGGRLEGAG
jgi:phage repressor protein C with HTH and peptisase S24 domain